MSIKIEMTRRFLPVGQGACYIERFVKPFEKTIVYDCGTTTSPVRSIEQRVLNDFKNGERIAILFISHFDKDHIAFIEALKNHVNIDRVILPYLYNEEKRFYVEIYKYAEKREENLLLNPKDYFPRSQVTYVKSPQEAGGLFDQQQQYQMDERIPPIIQSGTQIILDRGCWGYVPYNYHYGDLRERVREAFWRGIEELWERATNSSEPQEHKKTLVELVEGTIEFLKDDEEVEFLVLPKILDCITSAANGSLQDCFVSPSASSSYEFSFKFKRRPLIPRKPLDFLKVVYSAVADNNAVQINDNSMMVYSGPLVDDFIGSKRSRGYIMHVPYVRECPEIICNQLLEYAVPREKIDRYRLLEICEHCWEERRFYRSSRVGCVYTGDANLNLVDLMSPGVFGKWWSKVGTLQVPHHGDAKRHNKSLFVSNEGLWCPVSYGTTNTYGHPAFEVIDDISYSGNFPVKVTENTSSFTEEIEGDC